MLIFSALSLEFAAISCDKDFEGQGYGFGLNAFMTGAFGAVKITVNLIFFRCLTFFLFHSKSVNKLIQNHVMEDLIIKTIFLSRKLRYFYGPNSLSLRVLFSRTEYGSCRKAKEDA